MEVYPENPKPQPPRRSEPRPPARRHGAWWYIRWIVPTVLLAIIGFGLGAYLYLINQAETFTGERMVDRPRDDTSFTWNLKLNRRVTLLLIGTDVTLGNRRQILPVARADSLLLVTFDPYRGRIAAVSIPRDTRANIPGVGSMKINASYAFGGPGLTVKTVEELLGVRVDYFVKLGPKSFARLIDAVGGVEVDVEKDMKYTDTWAGLYIDLKKGRQTLNGTQAEGYIRFRKDALGDIGRVERQQKVVLALFRKMKNPAMVVRAPQLIRAFTENTQTNLTVTELLTLGMFAMRLDATAIKTATLPGRFGGNYWEPEWTKIRAVVLDMFHGVSPEMLAATRLEVLNGSGIPGAARRTAQRLERLGFRVVRIATGERTTQTLIIDRSGRQEITRLLAEVLGHSQVTRSNGVSGDAGVDITVLLARDYSVGAPLPIMLSHAR